jgi:hypothetical protein
MCDGLIDWCAFTWEAFATLAAGLAAVIAAWRLGKRQIAIQEKQLYLQAQSLKSELFERRLQNYETVRDLLNNILSTPDDIDPHLQSRFFVALREARFLFSANVYERLDEIWSLCVDLNALALQERQEISLNGHAGVELPQKKHDAYLAVNEKYKTLHETYAEMSLDKR